MGFGIVVLLICVPLSFLMWFKPRELWRATESWKFRNPEANEPSDFAYRLGAIGTTAATALLAVLTFTAPGPSTPRRRLRRRSTYPSRTSTTIALPPPSAFMPPPGMTRGVAADDRLSDQPATRRQPDRHRLLLGARGRVEGPGRRPAAPGAMRAGAERCRARAPTTSPSTSTLVWLPTTTSALPMNYDCNATRGHQVRRSYVVGPVSPSAKLFTSKPEADTPLPRLAEAAGPLGDPAPR